jgi:tetratricopeptide (TPR) repeat protein
MSDLTEPVTDDDEVSVPDAETKVADPSPWLVRCVALFPVVICFMGTGRSPWVHAIAALLIGLLVLRYPVQMRLPYSLLTVLGSIAVLTLLPLLPLHSPFSPGWRSGFEQDFGVQLAPTWSAQPWVTLEHWLNLVMLMLWFVWVVSQPRVTEQRAHVIRLLCAGISLLAVAALLLYAVDWTPMSWTLDGGRKFGPFANRNHFSTLMAINAVLCLASAYDLLRLRRPSWVLYALGLVPCFAVVLINQSRMGLPLFFGGVLCWFGASALRKRSMKQLAIGGSVLLALTTSLVLFGQHLLSRFARTDGSVVETLSTDGRWSIYSNTLDLILQHPVLGIGLGNFSAVFGITHQLPEGYSRFRHPESDLLWFIAEAGWPAGLAALAALLLFVSWIGPWRASKKRSAQRRERRLRLAAGVAVLLALAHGVVDVPGHELPLSLLLALLASVALYHTKLENTAGAAFPRLWRILGAGCMGASVLWALTGLGQVSPMGESIWQRDLAEARKLLAEDSPKTAWPKIERALWAAPLSWEAYYYRAIIGLQLGHSHDAAAQDFARVRYLEPHVAQICMAEADVWLRYDPLAAVPAWREALRREKTEEVSRYGIMLEVARQFPELRMPVRELATDARLLNYYLGTCTTDEEFREVLAELLQRYPELEGLNHVERASLFRNWRSRGDRTHLADMLDTHDDILDSHKDWMADGWMFRAAEFAANGKFKEAMDLALKRVTTTVNFSVDTSFNLDQLQREFLFNPSDAARGFRLALAQRDRKQFDEAMTTLEKVAAQPKAPKHVYFEMAKVLSLKGDHARAWEKMQSYLQF